MSETRTFLTVVADGDGQVFEHPFLHFVGGSGLTPRAAEAGEMIPLPEGSRLFTLPDTPALGLNPRSRAIEAAERLPRSLGGGALQAVCAFLTPGYTRTLLPAARWERKRVTLPLWSYAAVAWCAQEERFYAAAVKVDRNPQWRPEHYDDRQLDPLVRQRLKAQPGNRLLEQLARCAVDYHCFAAKNLFFGRWEAPLPIAPACNARCLGCISEQPSDCCPSSQERLTFVPTVEELCQVAVPHLKTAENAIVSFGQGCEGDPILFADRAAEAIRAMRAQTDRGTINFNSNASLPQKVELLADAGLESIRVSLNSVRQPLYDAYYRPQGYRFDDVIDSLHRAKRRGLFTMINYLVFPGVTDQREELEALVALVESAGVDLIQMRNLSLDPVLYWEAMGRPGPGIGMRRLLDELKRRVPRLQYGYFNRTRESFYPPGFETDWPLE